MSTPDIQPAVEIRFECTPLRTVSRLDIPLDASPGYRKRLERFQQAIAKHGHRNTYYLTEGSCVFRFTNNTDSGWVRFMIEGTVITDDTDSKTVGSDLTVQLGTETCDWLTQPAVEWLTISAKHAMKLSLTGTSQLEIYHKRWNVSLVSSQQAMRLEDF